jgi:hypothetical protein
MMRVIIIMSVVIIIGVVVVVVLYRIFNPKRSLSGPSDALPTVGWQPTPECAAAAPPRAAIVVAAAKVGQLMAGSLAKRWSNASLKRIPQSSCSSGSSS